MPNQNTNHLENINNAINRGDAKAVYDLLTVRQRRFCEEYSLDFDGKAATIRAGYAPKWADRQAHLLLKLPGVAFYIDDLTRSKEAKIVSVNPEYVIQRVLDIVESSTRDGDKLRGLELLARHLGMFIERTELTGKDGGPLETRQVEQDALAFTALLKTLADRANNADTEPKRVK